MLLKRQWVNLNMKITKLKFWKVVKLWNGCNLDMRGGEEGQTLQTV